MGDYQLAGTELALLHDKAARGVVSPEAFARRQQDLLGLMHVARVSFLARHPPGPGPDTVREARIPGHPGS
jgi:hypothetical protein